MTNTATLLEETVKNDWRIIPDRAPRVGPLYAALTGAPDASDTQEALTWISGNYTRLLAAVEDNRHAEEGWQFAEALHGWFVTCGAQADRVRVYTLGLESARESMTPEATPQMLTGLASGHIGTRDYAAARPAAEEALSLWQEYGHQAGQAAALGKLGVIATGTDRAEEALEHLGAARHP
ncbi:hypothetical protein SAMN05421505_12072 [Sinosporangium album]|uniref:Tetratricopeptide repeat-containing protein n=1 Tax=Sinosporangium album TaxID=504805 RepID=A0A1G8EF29_9ACTN|nr:hypothetical protein [Sinosporangium album]SDH68496.1 hypothetical protein SAMN05421505_12072 [Sinosporangium album]